MDIVSHLPRWAQKPTLTFARDKTLPGAEHRPLDGDSFEQSFKFAAGLATIAGLDEVAGEDDALGQLGKVSRNGLTLHFEGDTSDAGGDFQAVASGSRRGVNYASYVQASSQGLSTLRLVNDDGSIAAEASVAQEDSQGLEGYLFSRDFSA